MIIHAGDSISKTMMLLVDNDGVLFLVLALVPHPPLGLVQRHLLIQIFVNKLLDVPLVLALFGYML